MNKYVENLVKEARKSSYLLAGLTTDQKNKALLEMALVLKQNRSFILKENQKDIKLALDKKLAQSFIDRLKLTDKRLDEMSECLLEIAGLKDPIGQVISRTSRPNGIKLSKVRVPIGVVLIVYEARPNVTSDCVGLLFKTSNFGILRGGGDALNSNRAIGSLLNKTLKKSGIDFPVFFVVDKTEHKIIDELLKQNEYIDLVIPRGGEALIRKVTEASKIPVIKHYKGVCHIYVDKSADLDMALRICLNAKCQRSSVCNAVETILVDEAAAKKFLPALKDEFDDCRVKIYGCDKTAKIISGIQKATIRDWSTEYLDLIVAVKVVKNIEEAISHINTFGSGHTESIITKNTVKANKFLKEVDSACCFVNMSTRFSDGHQFGLGAEIGISTDKLHARGPMGTEELTTYKWVGRGSGQIRA